MRPDQQTRGTVVVYVPPGEDPPSEHERVTLLGFAQRLAALRGDEAAGYYDASVRHRGHLYFVPSSTLTADEAAALGIHGVGDLFGGVVPHRFVGTKAISHPLVAAGAAAPAGWQTAFAQRIGDAVLAGYAAYDLADAALAGRQLLAQGPVRVKPVQYRGGHGQWVVRSADELQALLAGFDDAVVAAHGLVLEEQIEEERTFSIGQVQVGELTASYHGAQRSTRNNRGENVFGGSRLTVVRGGFDELLALQPAPEIRRAVEQARRYDAAVQACFPSFFASRRNYDVLLGRDGRGRERSGVLEQSWRAGGATGPELAALEAFRADPARHCVRAACFEVFGDADEPPPDATVYFRGDDPRAGRLVKYTVLEPDDNAR